MRVDVGDNRRMRSVVLGVCMLSLAACTTYHDELSRAERTFEQNDPDRTLAVLRDIEPDFQRLKPQEQANYAFIRGMTDYNVGYKNDARHWLSVANAYEQVTPGLLNADRKTKTQATLSELNDIVYLQGYDRLVNARKDGASTATPAASSAAPPKKKKAPPQKPAADDPSNDD
jgi:hypothetical protein